MKWISSAARRRLGNTSTSVSPTSTRSTFRNSTFAHSRREALRGRLPLVVSIDPRFALAAASDDIERIYAKQRANRDRVAATSAAERIEKLRRFHAAIFAHRAEFYGALWADYQKPAPEVDMSEIYPVVSEARHAIKHLRRWMRPRRVATPLALLGSRSRILYEAKGVVL